MGQPQHVAAAPNVEPLSQFLVASADLIPGGDMENHVAALHAGPH